MSEDLEKELRRYRGLVAQRTADRIEELEQALYKTTIAFCLVDTHSTFSEKYADYCDALLDGNKELISWKFNRGV